MIVTKRILCYVFMQLVSQVSLVKKVIAMRCFICRSLGECIMIGVKEGGSRSRES